MTRQEFADLVATDRKLAVLVLVRACFDTLDRHELVDWLRSYHLEVDPKNYRPFLSLSDADLKSIADDSVPWDDEDDARINQQQPSEV